MNHSENSDQQVPVDTKPLFASVWLALYAGLRKNYNERHLVVKSDTGNLNKRDSKQPHRH